MLEYEYCIVLLQYCSFFIFVRVQYLSFTFHAKKLKTSHQQTSHDIKPITNSIRTRKTGGRRIDHHNRTKTEKKKEATHPSLRKSTVHGDCKTDYRLIALLKVDHTEHFHQESKIKNQLCSLCNNSS